MTSEQLGQFAGVLLSLLFSYVPGLNTWFAGLAKETKQLIMGVLLFVSAGIIFGLSCANLGGFNIACTVDGGFGFAQVLIAALVANQGTYLLSPQTQAVESAKPAKA